MGDGAQLRERNTPGPRRLIVAGRDRKLWATVRAMAGSIDVERLRDVDPESVRPDEDVIIAGRPASQSIGDRRLVAELAREGLPVLLVVNAGDIASARRGAVTDLIVAPFTAEELDWRLSRLVDQPPPSRGVEHWGLTIDHDSRAIVTDDRLVPLTPREYAVVVCLARHRGQPVSRATLAKACQRFGSTATGRALDALVHRLRVKIGALASHIETVAGYGYRLV